MGGKFIITAMLLAACVTAYADIQANRNQEHVEPMGDVLDLEQSSDYGEFYSLIPSDSSGVGVGSPVSFFNDGPSAGTAVRRAGPSTVQLEPGTYQVTFYLTCTGPAQLGAFISEGGGTLLKQTIVGRNSTNVDGQIFGSWLIKINSLTNLSIMNVGDTGITFTPHAGGQNPVSARLIIVKLS